MKEKKNVVKRKITDHAWHGAALDNNRFKLRLGGPLRTFLFPILLYVRQVLSIAGKPSLNED